MTKTDLELARRLANLADEGGTIYPERLVGVMSDPRDHRYMSIREAWGIFFPDIDPDDISEALWA
jgi:hypothetical protein